MMNEPSAGEHNPVTQDLINRIYVARDEIPRHMAVTIHCDTAFRYQKRIARSDSSVIMVWGHSMNGDGNVYYLFGCGSPRWNAETFTNKLVEVCQRYIQQGYRIRAVTDELEVGGKEGTYKLFLQGQFTTRGMASPPIILIRRFGGTNNRKIDRILDATNYWVDGKVFLVKDAPGVQELVSQMTRIGYSAHDDWADAASDVFDPSVYYIARNIASGEEDDFTPRRPYDEILKGGGIIPPPMGHPGADEILGGMYDQYWNPDGDEFNATPWSRPPVGLD